MKIWEIKCPYCKDEIIYDEVSEVIQRKYVTIDQCIKCDKYYSIGLKDELLIVIPVEAYEIKKAYEAKE